MVAALLAAFSLTPLESFLARSTAAPGGSAPVGLVTTLGLWGSPAALVVAATLLWLGTSLVFAAPLLPWVAVLFNDPVGIELPLVIGVSFVGVRICRATSGAFPTGIAGLTDCSTASITTLADGLPDAPNVLPYATSGQAGATFGEGAGLLVSLRFVNPQCNGVPRSVPHHRLLPPACGGDAEPGGVPPLAPPALRGARVRRGHLGCQRAGALRWTLSCVHPSPDHHHDPVQVAGVCAAVGAFASSCVWWGALGTAHQFNVNLCGRLFGAAGGSCTDATGASLPGTAAFGLAFFFNVAGAALALWSARYLGSVPGMTGLLPWQGGQAHVQPDAPFYPAEGTVGSAGEYAAPLISSDTEAAVQATPGPAAY